MTTNTLSRIENLNQVPGNSNLLIGGMPEQDAKLKERVDQYLNARAAQLLDVSTDGKSVLIATRFAATSQLHVVDAPLGSRYQLTFANEPISRGRFVPGDDHRIFYGQDIGGGEFYQIFEFNRQTGRSRLLTDGKSRHSLPLFSPTGKFLAFSGNGRNGKDTDVYLSPVPNENENLLGAERIGETSGTWVPVAFSPDGSKLLIQQFRAIDDSDLHVYDIAARSLKQITPKDGKGSIGDAVFSADGQFVYIVTDRYSDFNQLYKVSPEEPDNKPELITGDIPWNVETVSVTHKLGYLVFSVNEDGVSVIYTLKPGSSEKHKVKIPPGILSSLIVVRDDTDSVFFSIDSAKSPNDIYSLDLSSDKITRWTQSEVGGLNTDQFVEPKLVRYTSTESVTVPAFYYPVPGSSANNKVPVLVIFHGGPEGQSRPNFSPFTQFLIKELGIAVVFPNVRGSDGYGKTFLSLDNGIKREQSLNDIGATLDWIDQQPELDSGRIAVYGGSYGGYMVLSAVTRYPERIKAAVDIVGVSHIVTFLENTLEYRRDLRRVEYGDERDPKVREVQERISPLNHVEKIQAALFVQHGKNDPRVPQSEAEQIVGAVRKNGKDCWYLLALNEGHGFAKKENRDYSLVATVQFLREQLDLK